MVNTKAKPPSICIRHTPDNLAKMQRFMSHIHQLVDDEAALVTFIERNTDQIEWE